MNAMTLALAMLLAGADAAAQVRDRAPAPTGSASISGTVMSDSQPSRPVRRALVTINSTDRKVGRTAITDDAGRFAVTNLPAGRYNVDATKRGWVSAAYGARAIGRPGRSIALADGERAPAALRIARGAVITGVVVDQNGQPPTGVTMRAYRYAYTFNTGERRLTPASSTSWGPDDRGAYRIYGLAPGEYYVTASGSSPFMTAGRDLHLTSDTDVQEALRAAQGPSTPPVDVPQPTVGLAPVFYPGATAAAQATPVVVRAGEERGGVDFTIQYVRTVHVEGTVSVPEGTVPQSTQVNLVTSDPATPALGFESVRTARVGASGRFDFAEVTPGQYTLAARAALPAAGPGSPPQVLSAIADVDVQGEDVRGLALQLTEGFTVSGVVRLDGTAPPPPLTSMRVNLMPLASSTGVSISSAGTPIGADGRFTITGITPGRYRLLTGVPGQQSPWALQSSVAGGQDSLDVPVEIRQSIADAVITLTDRVAELTGRIDAAGAAPDYTIVLFSANRAHWIPGSRRVLTARTASDGSFVFKSVPPGEYQIAAVDDVEPGEWNDPAFLQRLSATALKVAIAEGEKKVQDIRIGGG